MEQLSQLFGPPTSSDSLVICAKPVAIRLPREKVSDPNCPEPDLRVLRTIGVRHLFPQPNCFDRHLEGIFDAPWICETQLL